MYQAHFGLKKPLFDNGIAQDAAVFFGPKHTEIAANCKLAFMTPDSAMVLTGPAGVGKTALMSTVLRTTSTRLALGWISVAPANSAELLELLLVELGVNAHRVGRVERVQMWRQFLNESSATSSRVYVIAERADELAPELLRSLDSLTAADPNGSLGANLVLLGQPALLDMLKSPMLESLRQRIRLRQRLEPLTADELNAYLEHHATLAGSRVDKLFTRNAVAALHELSGGIPRLANNLAETALTLAATRNERLVAAELVRHVAGTLFGIEPTPVARTAAASETRAPASVKSTPAAERLAAADQPTAPEPPVPRAAPEPIVRPSPEPPTVAAAPAAASAPRAAAPAPISAPARQPVAPEPAAARAVREPDAASEPAPSIAPPAPAASTRAASYSSGPPDPDLDAFADTLTDSPDVPMLDFPVLTDAVEPARARPRADTAYLKTPVAQQPAAVAKPAAPLPRVVAAPSAPTPMPNPRPAKPAPAAAAAQPAPIPAAAKPTPPPAPAPAQPQAQAADEDDVLRQSQTMRGLMAAKSIDDISDSMAETLFGEADLDMLSAALAASGWSEDEQPTVAAAVPAATKPAAPAGPSAPATPQAAAAKTAAPAAAPASAGKPASPAKARAREDDPFDFLGLGPDAPLELIDDAKPASAPRKEGTRNR